jgi:hypothetical protein
MWTFITSHDEALRTYAEMWAFDVADKEDVAKVVDIGLVNESQSTVKRLNIPTSTNLVNESKG